MEACQFAEETDDSFGIWSFSSGNKRMMSRVWDALHVVIGLRRLKVSLPKALRDAIYAAKKVAF